MISSGVIVQSNQLSRVGVTQQILHEGSSVLVRIIADKGNGRYTGSVAGIRVNFRSEKALNVGSSFVATISTKNGVIYVSPKVVDAKVNSQVLLNVAENSQIAGLLESLGLLSDELYLNLFQQLKQLGMKIDTQVMNKLHNLAIGFKGKQKKASEILTAFLQKGIKLSKEELFELLEYFDAYDDSESSNFHDETSEQLINKVNSIESGWFYLPFEMYNRIEDSVLGKGVIRLLFDSSDKLKLLNLTCNYNNKKYLYSLKFENSICKNIKFNITPYKLENVDIETSKLLKCLRILDYKPEIEWAEESEIEGSACSTEETLAVGGVV